MSKWIEGTVRGARAWTPRLVSLRVDAEIGSFAPGQWAKLALRVGGELVARPYSFVNAPRERPHEFYFNTVPEGRLSARLACLEPLDVVFLAPGASGTFVLAEVPDAENLWLMATGTGIGPYLSMLKTDAPWRRFRRIVLVHAVREAADLAYAEALDAIASARGEQFRRVRFVSRESRPDALGGRIPEAIADERLERAAGVALSAASSQVLLCGNPDMVLDVTDALAARGMRRHRRREPGHVLVEPYW